MTAQGWLQIVFYVGALTLLAIPLGRYMARVYEGERVLLTRVLRPARAADLPGPGPIRAGGAGLEGLRQDDDRLQPPLLGGAVRAAAGPGQPCRSTPRGSGRRPWDVTFNTTTSFVTNTNWQFYGGETTLSYLSQMAGLAVQNFVSAAIGMAVLIAVIRGLRSRGSAALGNFWQDLTRGLLYVLLPLSFLGALILVSQGVIQTFSGSVGVDTLHGDGRRSDARARPDRVPGCDQAARHQRRWLLQRQLGVSVREPDRVLELRRDAVHPPDPRRAGVHVRQHGAQPRARPGRSTRRWRC